MMESRVGHSIQNVGDRHAIFRDSDLMVLIALVRKELEDNSTAHERARSVVAAWRRQMEGYTPGCIELDFDGVAASPERTAAVLHLFDSLRAQLAATEKVSRATLTAYCEVPGVHFYGDHPAPATIETIDKLAALLRP
jgi:hypothetical protein